MPEVDPVPLADLTTLRVGAAPERMVDATERSEAVTTFREVWDRGDDWLVLGGGSNLLVGDEPFEGTVVRLLFSGIESLPGPREGVTRVRAAAGHTWDDLVVWSVNNGLTGIEAMSGIPGTVGAAPIQNVGAYGQEVVDTLVEIELLDFATGDVHTVPAGELELGPRTSVLKNHYGDTATRPGVVLSATFDLVSVGSQPRRITSERLRSALGLGGDAEVSLGWVRDRVLSIRAGKGMVLDPSDPDTASAGSFFQNPIVPERVARSLPAGCPRWVMGEQIDPIVVIPLDRYDGTMPPMPDSVERRVKVSAAWLIEHAGISKGFRLARSRAAISGKHALALTNRGGATAAEVAELARFVQQRVHAETGLILQPEPVFVGVEL